MTILHRNIDKILMGNLAYLSITRLVGCLLAETSDLVIFYATFIPFVVLYIRNRLYLFI